MRTFFEDQINKLQSKIKIDYFQHQFKEESEIGSKINELNLDGKLLPHVIMKNSSSALEQGELFFIILYLRQQARYFS